jgi:hypothetical protein
MNIIKQIIDSIAYADLFGIISTAIFFAVFAAILYWVLRLDKGYVKHMSQLPLEHSREKTGEDNHV